MGLQSSIMAVIESTWQLSAFAGKYILIGLFLIPLFRAGSSGAEGFISSVSYAMGEIPLKLKNHIVYGLLASGIISAMTFTEAGLTAASAVVVYILYKGWKLEESKGGKPEGIMAFTGLLIQLSVVLASIASIFLNNTLLNNLTALYLYGIIFWKI
ncbi:MAG: hypothetical protein SVV03_06740 [Candidatus Nanohaloarchaea archaeon]|nr:hypothetical protein [Candidatus Nanohaloarchaea archaeon]